MDSLEEVKFKRELKKEEEKHIKPKFKSIGSALEATEMTLKYFYLPFFLFGIIFGPTIIGTVFLGLFFACFMTSQVIGTSIKDEFKDTSDNVQKGEFKADVKAQSDSMTKIREYSNELQQIKNRIAQKQKQLGSSQTKQTLQNASLSTKTENQTNQSSFQGQ